VPIFVLLFPFAELHALYLENIWCEISFRKHRALRLWIKSRWRRDSLLQHTISVISNPLVFLGAQQVRSVIAVESGTLARACPYTNHLDVCAIDGRRTNPFLSMESGRYIFLGQLDGLLKDCTVAAIGTWRDQNLFVRQDEGAHDASECI
jgi:hypothetical protein